MAIAFDIASDGGLVNPGTSLTWSHTCTGSDLILFAGCFGQTGSDVITGITYNGVAMTLVDKILEGGASGRYTYLFYLLNPATGAHDVVISASGSTAISGLAASYTGVKQSGQPDASAKNSAAGLAGNTDYTTSVTTIADNCWTVLFAKNNSGAPTASAGSTEREDNGNGIGIYDSNGVITPAGARSMLVKTAGVADWGSVMASFAPAVTTSVKDVIGSGFIPHAR